MKDQQSRTFTELSKEISPLADIHQAILDDTKYESMAIGTIIHRTNYLHSLVNQQAQEQSKHVQESLSISISREAKYIISLIAEFYVMKTQHFESQHGILSRLIKRLKKHR